MKILLATLALALLTTAPAHAILRPRVPHHTWPPATRDGGRPESFNGLPPN